MVLAPRALLGLITSALLLASCGDPRIQGQQSPTEAQAPACDARDRTQGPGAAAKACVLIGHDTVVRFQPPVGRPGAATMATVCNTSETERVYIAWAKDRAAPADGLWKAAPPDYRRTVASKTCETVGPLMVVLLRGWHDGGQGFDIATSWDATVSFAAAP